MEATRARVSSLLEWLAAGACIIGLVAAGSVLVRDLRTVAGATPVIAHEEESVPEPPAVIPSRSVSVPVLLLSDGAELHVGDTAEELAQRLRHGSEVAPRSIDRVAAGERVTRFYAEGGQRFAIVLQPLADDGQVRVAAIYLPSSR